MRIEMCWFEMAGVEFWGDRKWGGGPRGVSELN